MAIWERKDTEEIRYTAFRPSKNWHQVNKSRVQEIERNKAVQKARAYYEPGGGYGKGVEAGLERERTQVMSSGMQALVASGLAGTTMAGGLGKKFSEEVGMPTRAGIEETRAQAISGIEMGQAGWSQQTGMAAAQMQFQARQAQADRDLQKYLANLQISRRAGPTMGAAPTRIQPARRTTYTPPATTFRDTGSSYAGLGTRAVSAMMPTMAPFGGEVYGTQEAFEMYGLPEPPTGSVPMGRRYGPTIEEPPEPSMPSTFFWESIGR